MVKPPGAQTSDPRSREALLRFLTQAGAIIGEGKLHCYDCLDLSGSAVIYPAGDGLWRYKCKRCGVGGTLVELQEKHNRDIWGALWDAPGSREFSTARQAGAPVPAGPASELRDVLEAQISGGWTNYAWPWPWLTGLVQALTPGARLGVVGSGGASKSFLVTQALAFWVEQGIQASVLELERSRSFHLCRILAQRCGVADLTKADWVRAHPDKARGLFREHREFLDRMGQAIHTVPRQFTIAQAADWVERQAGEGARIVVVDPVTALSRGRDPWIADELFLSRIEQAARTSGASIVTISHPRKGGSGLPDLDNVAGGAVWVRSLDSVVWLEAHDSRTSRVQTPCGTDEQRYNRTLYLLKTRSGEGENKRLAYRFQNGKEPGDTGALTFRELGVILRSKKGKSDE
ncbi:MAG: AAA family ATPase [Phycisphaerae bacterium]|nr:AAA family ATPase [Phycisphaerae bacterium]